MISVIRKLKTFNSIKEIIIITLCTLININIKFFTIIIRCIRSHSRTTSQSMIKTLVTTVLLRLYFIMIICTYSTFINFIIPFCTIIISKIFTYSIIIKLSITTANSISNFKCIITF